MSETKFTPGPWFFDGPPDNHIVWSSGENRICFMAHSNGIDPERDTATAALVSAAPDMYEALQALDESWTNDFPEGPDGACRVLGGVLSESTRTIWRNARAALAKARGEEPK